MMPYEASGPLAAPGRDAKASSAVRANVQWASWISFWSQGAKLTLKRALGERGLQGIRGLV
jgi:hypothetical protein